MPGPDDYCELCDLPLSTCVHGMPKPEPQPEPVRPTPAKKPAAPRRKTATPSSQGVRTKQVPRRWTPPAEFVPHVMAVLEEAGGSLPTDDALARIEQRVGDDLRPGDHERTPQGELRWRTAARKARRELVQEGRLSADQPGVWQLND